MAMPHTAPWTIADLDRLPDDGNRYEVLEGDLYVTPAPSDEHQEIAAWLNARLVPFVSAYSLGRVYHPRSVIQTDTSQLEPDLMVRPIASLRGWRHAPTPILVIEIASRSTRRRDFETKRDFYTANGIPEYWIVDREERRIVQILRGVEHSITKTLRWSAIGTDVSLEMDVEQMFAETSR